MVINTAKFCLSAFVASLAAATLVSTTRAECGHELVKSSFGAPNNPENVIGGLLSGFEREQLSISGVAEKAFVIKLPKRSEIHCLSLWSDRQPNGFLVWYRRMDDGSNSWLPIKTVYGDRKIFRSSIKNYPSTLTMSDDGQPIVADQLLLLPLRQLKEASDKLRYKVFGQNYDADERFFCGTGDSKLVYDLKTFDALKEPVGGVAFNMKTTQNNGVIIASAGSQGDFCLVQLRDNRLMTVIDFGAKEPHILRADVVVNDGLWHTVSLTYKYDNPKLFVDGVLMDYSSIQLSLGYRLDLDHEVHIGGAPYAYPFLKFMVGQNFSGFLSNLTWNHQSNLIKKAIQQNQQYLTDGCSLEADANAGSVVSFTNGDSRLEKLGRRRNDLSSITEFSLTGRLRTVSTIGYVWRTVDSESGRLWSDRASNLSLLLIDGVLSSRLMLDGEWMTLSTKARIDDSLWHRFHLKILPSLIELVVDEQQTARLEARFDIFPPIDAKYMMGGGGFVGCVGGMTINGYLVEVQANENDDDSGVIRNACSLWNRCNPNPCRNNGVCRPSGLWNEFECECLPGYWGKTCQSVDLPHSCEQLLEFGGKAGKITIDMDDVGLLRPLDVECSSDGWTRVAHQHQSPVEVYGFGERGSAKIDYSYGGLRSDSRDSLTVAAFTERAVDCHQQMDFKCQGGASLMQNPATNDQGPSTWWMSWSANDVYAWGAGEDTTLMCSCAVHSSCKSGGKCNCGNGTTQGSDVGNVTRKDLLPVRHVFVGDTDFDGKRASIDVGPLLCHGDKTSIPVTFLERSANLEIPFERIAHSPEAYLYTGYLQFRTDECLFSLLTSVRGRNTVDDSCEYLRIYVEDCRTVTLATCGSGGIAKLSANFTGIVSDGRWHSIRFTVSSLELTLTLDNDSSRQRSSVGHLYAMPDANALSAWRIGANSQYGSGFTGVLHSAVLNGQKVSLDNNNVKISGHVKAGIINRCVSPDRLVCLNGGICIDHYHSVDCDCSETPYVGNVCEQDVSYELVGALKFNSAHEAAASGGRSDINYLRIGFQTTRFASALIRGFDRQSKTEVLTLILTRTGTLRLMYTENRTPYIVEEDCCNFSDGYFHDVQIFLDSDNRVVRLLVDGWHRQELSLLHLNAVRMIIRGLDWVVGDDDSISQFSGCVSRLQIGKRFFPLKRFSSLLEGKMTSGNETHFRRSMCPVFERNFPAVLGLHEKPPSLMGIDSDASTALDDGPRLKIRPLKRATDGSLVISIVAAVALCLLLILLCCLIRFLRSHPAGEYKTHEETLYLSGPLFAQDSSQQALVSASAEDFPSPPVERREWFI